MSYLGDTLTVGLILVLLFGSIALYLYTRIQQTEQKVSLLESIVLDLKLTGELPVFGEFPSSSSYSASSTSASPVSSASASASPASPASSSSVSSASPVFPDSSPVALDVHHDSLQAVSEVLSSPLIEQEYTPFSEEGEDIEELVAVSEDEHLPVEESIAIHPLPEESPYDTMSVKELQNVVRTRGLASEKGAKKQALIDLLKRSDQTMNNEAKQGSGRSSTFLETSSILTPSHEDAE
jgi:hypothetical protein